MKRYFLFLAIIAVSNLLYGQPPAIYDLDLDSPTKFYTPKNSPVITYKYIPGEMTSGEITTTNNLYTSKFALKTANFYIVGSSSNQYNCHFNAFINSTDRRWLINDGSYSLTEVNSKYIADKSYITVPKDIAYQHSDAIAFYNNSPDHSASVVKGEMDWVFSKCGVGPLVKHKLDEYYTGSCNNITFYLPYYSLPTAPTSISGPDLVQCSGTVSYSISGVGMSSISWTTSNLTIVSGQGTNTLVVSKNSGSTSQSGQVSVSGTFYTGASVNLSKVVNIGVPYVKSLTANMYSVNAGGYITFTVDPSISSGSYEWMVSPSTNTSQYIWNGNKNDITFYSPGTYVVGVRTYMSSPCIISPGTYTTVNVNVN